MKADRGDGHDAADQRAQAERRRLEEDRARIALDLLVRHDRHRRSESSAGGAPSPGRGGRVSGATSGGVAE
jgi:hypothetical protein